MKKLPNDGSFKGKGAERRNRKSLLLILGKMHLSVIY
jgi:hypothetical protein